MNNNRSKRGMKTLSCGNCDSCGKSYNFSPEKLRELKESFKLKGCLGENGRCGSLLLLTCWEINHRCSVCFNASQLQMNQGNVESEKDNNYRDDNGQGEKP